MNPGLTYLLRKRAVGKARQLRRRMRGPKGLLIGGFAALLVLGFVTPQIVARLSAQATPLPPGYADMLRLWGPPGLFLFGLAGALSARGLYFTPAEIDLLFAAPVSRRQLLLYSVLARLGLAALSAAWAAIVMSRQATHWYGALAGVFLGIAFLQLAGQAAGLVFANVSERLAKPLRRVVTIGFLTVIGAVLLVGGALVPRAAEVIEAARAVASSPPVRIVTALARPMIEVFVAADVTSFLAWLGAAVLVLGTIVLVMTRLDVAYLEASLATSARVQAKLRRLRTGGAGRASETAATRSIPPRRLPMPARLAGVGPIAWRQLVAMSRDVRALVTSIVIAVPATLVPLLLLSSRGDPSRGLGPALIGALVLSLMITQHFAFDFRRDLDRMPFLKSLPVSPLAVAAGQLVSATLLFTLMQCGLLATIVLAAGSMPPALGLAIAVLLPFANWIVAAIDNALFLLLPYRLVPDDPGSMPFMGRLMLAMFVKVVALLIIGGGSVTAAFFLWKWGERSLLAGTLGAVAVLALAAVALTALVGRAFAAFDVTQDVPG